MRCSNCSSPLLDGTPVCSQCGHVNEADAGRPPESTPADPAPKPARGGNLRAKLGAPKPASAPPADDSTDVNKSNSATDAAMSPLPEPEAARPAKRPASGAKPAPAARGPMRRPGSAPAAPRARKAESTEREGDPDDADTADTARPTRNVRAKSPAARRFADPEPDDADADDANPDDTSRDARRNIPNSSRPLVQPGKYGSVADSREAEGTVARPELAQQEAAAPPPVNPEEIFHNIVSAVKTMAFEDRLESFSAAGLIIMTFMPWRTVRSEGDIGLLTWAGFLALLFASGVIGLIYLRFTGRVPTFTSKMLATGELALSALPLLFTLIFIFTSIDRTTFQYGALKAYASMPDFGSILALLTNFALGAGAALVYQRESKQGRR